MTEVRVHALEAQLDIGGLMDPGSMAEAVSLELDGDEAGTVPPWPHDSWVELNAEPTGFVTLVAAEDDEMEGLLTRVEAALRRDERVDGPLHPASTRQAARERVCDVLDGALSRSDSVIQIRPFRI